MWRNWNSSRADSWVSWHTFWEAMCQYLLKVSTSIPWTPQSPLCIIPTQMCTYVHKYTCIGMFIGPQSLRLWNPRCETVHMPINGRMNKAWHIHTVGRYTRREWANHNCMEQDRRTSQRKEIRHQITYCWPDNVISKLHASSHWVLITRPWVAVIIPFY